MEISRCVPSVSFREVVSTGEAYQNELSVVELPYVSLQLSMPALGNLEAVESTFKSRLQGRCLSEDQLWMCTKDMGQASKLAMQSWPTYITSFSAES